MQKHINMEVKKTQELIVDTISKKSVLKQDVFNNIQANFKLLKKALKEVVSELNEKINGVDNRIEIKYTDKSEFEAQLQIAGDVLVFHMHTNVFKFDASNSIWKTSYLKEDENRGYAGVIHVYNFLTDSFKYNRVNDSGYLIARMFVNNENHFMVQGKRQLGFLYNDFVNAIIDESKIKAVLESAVLYTLDFDLYTPPYDAIKEISVYQITEMSNSMQIKTGKRLGFQFSADSAEIE